MDGVCCAGGRRRSDRRLVALVGAVLAGVVGLLVTVAPAASAFSPPQIYWGEADAGTIGSATIDGTNLNQSFITGAASPEGVAVDGSRVYWANAGTGTIGEAGLDGSGANQSFITGGNEPGGVAVNGQHIYWANFTGGSLGEANLNGTGINQTFITGANGPLGVAVDGQHIYWTNNSTGTIGRSNLNGTDVNQTFITGANEPHALAVDGQHIYWTNFNGNSIGEANLNGTDVNQTLITGAGDPFGLAVDAQHIYWANLGNDTIGEANLNGTDVDQSSFTVTGANVAPYGLAVSVPHIVISPASPPTFPVTARATLSAPRTLTISNDGQQDLSITGLGMSGADPGDFAITSNTCLGTVAPGEDCQVTIAFAPQAQGARSATLAITSNDYADSPLAVPLSGTGGSLPTGPTGPRGSTGPTGATGKTGPRGHPGKPGKIELVTCKTVTKKVKGRPHTVRKCTGKLVSGTVKFTTSESATVSRGHLIYATGTKVQLRRRTELILVPRRRMRPGRYTLTSRHRIGRHVSARRTAITLD